MVLRQLVAREGRIFFASILSSPASTLSTHQPSLRSHLMSDFGLLNALWLIFLTHLEFLRHRILGLGKSQVWRTFAWRSPVLNNSQISWNILSFDATQKQHNFLDRRGSRTKILLVCWLPPEPGSSRRSSFFCPPRLPLLSAGQSPLRSRLASLTFAFNKMVKK